MGKIGILVAMVVLLAVFQNCQSTQFDTMTELGKGQSSTYTLKISQTEQTMQTKWGLLLGYTTPCETPPCSDPSALILDLKPQDWRLANFPNDVLEWVTTTVDFSAQIGTEITFIVQDAFSIWYNSGFSKTAVCINPTSCPFQTKNVFADYNTLKNSWSSFLDIFVANPGAAEIDIFDIFAEPDDFFQNLTEAQLFELYKIAHDKIRLTFPSARLKGLSDKLYDPARLERFYDYVLAENLSLFAISWHEFGIVPINVPSHVQTVRDFVAAKGCIGTCPEIHIDEYQPPSSTMIPGDQTLWLVYLVDAGVNRINRACWDVAKQGGGLTTTCWNGFNGMLDETNTFTQAGYWVHKYFADMRAANKRLKVESFDDAIHALSFLNEPANKMEILVGTTTQASTSTSLNMLVQLPSAWNVATVTISAKLIPNNGNIVLSSNTTPTDVTLEASVINGRLHLDYQLPKGAALYISILK